MIPADAALLSLLALKLLRKERLSHIDDFNEDEGLGRVHSRFAPAVYESRRY